MKEKEIKEDQEAKADSKTAETPAPQELRSEEHTSELQSRT